MHGLGLKRARIRTGSGATLALRCRGIHGPERIRPASSAEPAHRQCRAFRPHALGTATSGASTSRGAGDTDSRPNPSSVMADSRAIPPVFGLRGLLPARPRRPQEGAEPQHAFRIRGQLKGISSTSFTEPIHGRPAAGNSPAQARARIGAGRRSVFQTWMLAVAPVPEVLARFAGSRRISGPSLPKFDGTRRKLAEVREAGPE